MARGADGEDRADPRGDRRGRGVLRQRCGHRRGGRGARGDRPARAPPPGCLRHHEPREDRAAPGAHDAQGAQEAPEERQALQVCLDPALGRLRHGPRPRGRRRLRRLGFG